MIKLKDEAIKTIILQREPMMMVDTFYGATESETNTGLTIVDDNLFCSNGLFTEPGLIEHIAQSASAFWGYKALLANRPSPLGFLGEVKKCSIHFLPKVGDELSTSIRFISEALGVSLFVAETKVNGTIVVECQMKIFITPS